jgi:hypothetical protein
MGRRGQDLRACGRVVDPVARSRGAADDHALMEQECRPPTPDVVVDLHRIPPAAGGGRLAQPDDDLSQCVRSTGVPDDRTRDVDQRVGDHRSGGGKPSTKMIPDGGSLAVQACSRAPRNSTGSPTVPSRSTESRTIGELVPWRAHRLIPNEKSVSPAAVDSAPISCDPPGSAIDARSPCPSRCTSPGPPVETATEPTGAGWFSARRIPRSTGGIYGLPLPKAARGNPLIRCGSASVPSSRISSNQTSQPPRAPTLGL